MMKRLLLSATMLVAASSMTQAQGATTQPDPECVAGPSASEDRRLLQDACQKAVDLFAFMSPQLGTALAGGNATLGQGSTLGGLGHLSFGLRATAVQGSIPQFDSSNRPDTGAAVSKTYETKKMPVPMAAVDLAVGLFKGVPLGVTNLGGIDLLLSASYVPEFGDRAEDDIILEAPNGSLKLGYGARIGILQEGLVMPGLAVTYLMRGLPELDITAVIRDESDPSQTDSIYVRKLKLDASSWRIVASKKLLFVGLAAGYGQDTYKSSANVGARVVQNFAIGPIVGNQVFTTDPEPLATFDQKVTRSNMFANLSINLVILKLSGEIGQVSGGTIDTFNKFADEDGEEIRADKSRTYASVGFRVGF